MAHAGPKMPKIVPRWPKIAPKLTQDGPQMAPRWPKWSQEGVKMAARWPKTAPKQPKMAPTWPQDGAKMGMAPRWHKIAPRWPEMAQGTFLGPFGEDLGSCWDAILDSCGDELGTEKGKTLEQHRKQMLRIGKKKLNFRSFRSMPNQV